MSSDDEEVNVYAGGGAEYDPEAPVPVWHQNMELITICVCNSLSLIFIITRLVVRRRRIKKFRRDDIWIMVAGGILVVPHWVCQLGTNRYGSGLSSANIPDEWLVPIWLFQIGWVGYYVVISMIKTSVCFCLLEILPHSFRNFRRGVYLLCTIIMALGIAESLVWIFQCQPFLSNFNYDILPVWCVNIDKARYAWIGLSMPIDLAIIGIPYALLRQIRLERHERIVLYLVFGANLLGTFTNLFGIYGVWVNRESQAYADLPYSQTVFVMTNDIEILMYTVGASATVFSRYFVSKAAAYTNRSREPRTSEQLSWRRKMDSTFSGSYTLPSTWHGQTGHEDLIQFSETPRSPSTIAPSEKGKFGLSVVPVLNDVGGLGTDQDPLRNKSKGSSHTGRGRDPYSTQSQDLEKGIRHDSWFGAGSSVESPVSTTSAWDWGMPLR